MSAAAGCELIGRWRIVEADLWDRDYLDLVEPAYMSFGKNGRGEFAFGAVDAIMELGYGQRIRKRIEEAFGWIKTFRCAEVISRSSAPWPNTAATRRAKSRHFCAFRSPRRHRAVHLCKTNFSNYDGSGNVRRC